MNLPAATFQAISAVPLSFLFLFVSFAVRTPDHVIYVSSQKHLVDMFLFVWLSAISPVRQWPAVERRPRLPEAGRSYLPDRSMPFSMRPCLRRCRTRWRPSVWTFHRVNAGISLPAVSAASQSMDTRPRSVIVTHAKELASKENLWRNRAAKERAKAAKFRPRVEPSRSGPVAS